MHIKPAVRAFGAGVASLGRDAHVAALSVMNFVGQASGLAPAVYDVVFARPVHVGEGRRGVIHRPVEPGEPGEHLARGGVIASSCWPDRRGHDVGATLQVPDRQRGDDAGNETGPGVMDAYGPQFSAAWLERLVPALMRGGGGAGAHET